MRAERQEFERMAKAALRCAMATGGGSLTAEIAEAGYTIVDAPPASGGRATVTYWCPSGDLETSTIP
jgi:hypothetical protein